MKEELLERAKEAYRNAICFYENGKKNDFYRYFGAGEAFERILRENYFLSIKEDEELSRINEICEEYDDTDMFED